MSKKTKKIYPIGKNVKMAREDKEKTQAELAALMGVDRQRISKIESGANCEVSTYYNAAEKLGITFEQLATYHLTHKKNDSDKDG